MKRYCILGMIVLCIFSAFAVVTYVDYLNKPSKMVTHAIVSYQSPEDLYENSVLVIEGEISDIKKSKWGNPKRVEGKRNILQTDYVVKIDSIIKGQPYDQEEVIVRLDIGKNKDFEVMSDSLPDFERGEKVLLDLSFDDGDLADPNESYYVLTGYNQGAFKPVDEEKKTFKNLKDEVEINHLEKTE